MKSQIDALFTSQTNTHLWSQQIFGVLIRRSQVFIRRARLLLIVLVLYLIYALAPLYMPSFAPSSSERIRYIISSTSEFINKLNLKNFETKFIRSFNSSQEFQQYLLGKYLFLYLNIRLNQSIFLLFRITNLDIESSFSKKINRYSNNFFRSTRMLYSITYSIQYNYFMFTHIFIIF
jgi:hypothetical protein